MVLVLACITGNTITDITEAPEGEIITPVLM